MRIDAPGKETIPELQALWKEAFSDSDEFLDQFWTSAFSPKRCRCITTDGEVIASLYWFDCTFHGKRLAYLYAIATEKKHRGQGFCRMLLEDTHQHLKSLGYQGTIVVPGEKDLFAFYEKFGYQVCSHFGELRAEPSGSHIDIRRIDGSEYMRLRRHFLPEGGVIQEGENINFLQATTELYAGENFLLAALREGKTLYGVEFLGNRKNASDIVSTLGCSSGIFRFPAEDIPFAMYLSLNDQKDSAPTYFGLAFDE